MNTQNLSLLDCFLKYILDERHFTQSTGKCYSVDLRQFMEILAGFSGVSTEDQQAVDGLVLKASSNDLLRVIETLKSGFEYSLSTVSRKIAVIKSFYRWMERKGLIQKNLAKEIPSKSPRRIRPAFVGDEQIERLLTANVPDNFFDIRDSVLIRLICATGLRVCEVAALNRGDLDLGKSTLVVGINRKRTIPLSDAIVRTFRDYLPRLDSFTRVVSEGDDNLSLPLFVNKDATRLSPRSIRRRTDIRSVRSGFEEGAISTRKLRYTFIRRVMNNGMDERDLQQAMGHRVLSTTRSACKLIKMAS